MEAVRQSAKVHTPVGCLRLLIRICLTKKCLYVPVQLLVSVAIVIVRVYAIWFFHLVRYD